MRPTLARQNPNVGPHAFQINQLHGFSGLFPLGFSLSERGQGVWSADLHAQSVAEAAEVLPWYANDRLCIYDVADCSYMRGEVSLVEAAKGQGITISAPDRDVILIGTTDLPALLANFRHYDMSLLDMGRDVDEDTALGYVLAAMDVDRRKGESVLHVVRGSDLFLHSHDDCYLYVESRRWAHVKDHLRCLLKQYASSRIEGPVPLPPSELVENYLAHYDSLTVIDDRAELVGGVLRFPCSSEPFSFLERRDYASVATVLVDIEAGQWSLEDAG
jgi:hypothetical protein